MQTSPPPAAQVVGSILEWHVKEPQIAVHDTARLIAHYFRIKNAESPSKGAAENARRFDEAAAAAVQGANPRTKAAKELVRLARAGLAFTGNPVDDWRQARRVLQTTQALNEIFREARLVRLFRATDALGAGLGEAWLQTGSYAAPPTW